MKGSCKKLNAAWNNDSYKSNSFDLFQNEKQNQRRREQNAIQFGELYKPILIFIGCKNEILESTGH